MIHQCLNCTNTIEEIKGKFPAESKNWRRIFVPTRNFTYWFCSEKCQEEYFQSNPTFLSRAERRWLVKHGYNLSSLKEDTRTERTGDLQEGSGPMGSTQSDRPSDRGTGGTPEGTV